MKTSKFTPVLFLITTLFMVFVLRASANHEEEETAIASSNVQVDAQINNLTLGQSYPNPANEIAVIPVYNVAEGGAILIVFDVLGNSVYSQELVPGYNEAQLYTGVLAAGTYFYRVIDSFKDDQSVPASVTGKMEVSH